jgi:membrane protease subunit (stomatin/prohibitin family)
MGLLDKIRGEFIDIIEWLDESRDTMVYRFERYGNEIKMGAKLVVRESQVAVFVSEGRLGDVFQPGTHELRARNLPILSTLLGWKYAFESPFKSEVYFVSTRQFTDLKWGTQNPVIVRDPEFGPVRLRAFGGYAIRVADPAMFLRQMVGTDPHFQTDEATGYLRQLVATRVSTALAEAKLSVADIAAQQGRLGDEIGSRVGAELKPLGLEVTMFLVENVSLPPEVEQALDKRAQMGIVGDPARYTQFQAADALRDAASNPGGGAGAAVGLGAGFALGQKMGEAMAAPPAPPGYYLGSGGTRRGPFDLQALGAEAAAGRLTADTLVWRTGMAGWVPARDVPELAALLRASPPPLPS